MTIRLSTGLRNGMLNATGLKEAMADGKIKIFSGPQPTTADAAEQGTLLAEITVDAGAWTAGSPTNGLEFGTPASGTVGKATAETWRALGVAAGTAGWFRFVANATDAGGSSTTLARIDGTCGVSGSGADAIFSTVNVVIGQPITCDQFNITLPA